MKVYHNIQPLIKEGRGAITVVLDDKTTMIRSVLLITSKKGGIRGNHYHKKDSHYCYMLSGRMEYFEKPVNGEGSKIQTAVLKTGDMVYSPPMHIHAFRFLEDTVWVVLATQSRQDGTYEEDTIRVKLI